MDALLIENEPEIIRLKRAAFAARDALLAALEAEPLAEHPELADREDAAFDALHAARRRLS